MRNVALHTFNRRLLSLLSSSKSVYGFSSVLCLADRQNRYTYLQSVTNVQSRGAKSRATITLSKFQQDGQEAEQPLQEAQDDAPGYPAVVRQARNNMRKFENCVLLTRVGSFYEVYTLKRTFSNRC